MQEPSTQDIRLSCGIFGRVVKILRAIVNVDKVSKIGELPPLKNSNPV